MATSLTISEKEVVQAITSDIKIHEHFKKSSSEAGKQFRVTLAKCLVIAGIKNEIDDPTLAILWNYIRGTYGYSTFAEIEKAVMFNTSGKFEERIEHFQSFDLNYLSKVMEQWLIFKTKTRQRISALLPKPEPDKIPTPEESYEGLKTYVQKNGEFPSHWSWPLAYKWMEENLMIEATLDEKHDLYTSEMERLTAKIELDAMSNMNHRELNEKREALPEQAKLNCRKIMVKKYLKLED